MINREDFKNAVAPFFEKVSSYDAKMHGDLSEFVIGAYKSCVALKNEYVDYSFGRSGPQLSRIKLFEDMLIACHAFKLAIEMEECSSGDMLLLYGNLQEIGKARGWDSDEFDKNCLRLMGIELRCEEPSIFSPSIQQGIDYN